MAIARRSGARVRLFPALFLIYFGLIWNAYGLVHGLVFFVCLFISVSPSVNHLARAWCHDHCSYSAIVVNMAFGTLAECIAAACNYLTLHV